MANEQGTKKAAKSKAAKKKTASSKATTKGAKGKRYSDSEKAAVIDFVNKVNAERGRGGIAAAVKEFGVTAISISNWLKGTGAVRAKPTRGRPRKISGGRDQVLGELTKLNQEIATARGELEGLEARFEKLKAAL